jgi:hypothetical protein
MVGRPEALSPAVFRLSDPLGATSDYAVSSDAISVPGGNAAIMRHIVKELIPEAITNGRQSQKLIHAGCRTG